MYFYSCVLYALFVFSAVDSSSIRNDFDSALLGPEHCLDSSYWCTNFTTSVECNAVNHCIQVVWQNQKSVYGSCGNCEAEIQSIRDSIDSNFTKGAMQDLLENICGLSFLTSVFRKTCENLVDKYVDSNFNELLDLLTSEVDPTTICHLLGFCSSTSLETPYEDDAVVRFDNIELHFPAKLLDLPDMNTFVGASQCTWGPSQWCGNLTSARECDAHNYCFENVWKTSEFPEDNDSVCQICKDMVKQARDQLQSNETQQELKDVFEGSCKLIPIKTVSKECINVADQFIPELTEMLVSAMNPTAVCSVAGLCNSARIDKLIAANPGTNSELKLDSCVNCTVAFTNVEKFLQQNSKVNVMNRLLQVCGELSSFSDSCSTLLARHFDDLYQYLLNLQPWSACHMSGMCAYKYHFHPQPGDVELNEKAELMLQQQSDDLPCDLCKQLVTHFRDVLIANTTEDEFLQVLKGICKQTGKFEKECTDLVEEDFKIIYDFLTNELDPPKICAEVNLCPRKNLVSDINLNLIQDKYTPIINTQAEILPQKSFNLSSSTECRLCKYFIQILQREIEDPTVEADVKSALEKVCKLVPRSDVDKCNKFVEQYSDVLIDLLAKETDPGIICATIDFCPDVRLVSKFEFCPLCQTALNLIQKELEDPKTEQQIENSLKKVCAIVPQAEARQCNEFMSQYSALVISVLAEEIDPSLVCPALKLCPTLNAAQDQCQSCTQAMNTLISPLKKRDSLSVYRGLKSMVKSVPKHLTETAVQIQIQHSSEIVDMMMAEFTAEESCTYLKYCNQYPKYDAVIGGDIESNEIEASPNDIILNTVSKPSCEVCELFVKLYENKLTSKTTEEELEQLMTKYCDHLTDKDLQQNCTAMVDKYVPKFFDLLKKDVTPKELCQLAKICPAFSSTSSLQKCRSCEVTLGSLQGVLADPYIMNSEFLELDKICSYVSTKNRKVCDMAVLTLGRQIEGLALGIPSWYYCSKVHLCPYKSELIQFEDCTAGESFWCRGNETAIACDKLEYCRDTVWKSDQPSRN